MRYRLRRISKWIFYTNSPILKTCAVITATAVVSYTFASVSEITQKIEFLGLIFISAVVIISALYINEILEIDDTFKKVFSIPLDATMRYVEKKVVFDDSSLNDKSCLSVITRTLHNHMNEEYKSYLTEIESEKSLPNPVNITYIKNGDLLSFANEVQELCLINCFKDSNTDINNPDSKKMSFKLPIQVESNEICDFSLSYRTNAYEEAYNGKKDYFSFTVNRFTEKMIIKVELKGNITSQKKISYPKENEPDGSKKRYEIVDAADEKMWSTEKKMQMSKDIPKINRGETEIIWRITEPQIGYTYIIYFTLLDR